MAPCGSWITDQADLCGECVPNQADDAAAQAIIDRWGPVATLLLWAATGRQFGGVCPDKVWPNVEGCCGQTLAYPGVVGGSRPLLGDCAQDHCSVLLPHRPVRRVTEVRIDGDVVDPASYRLKDRRWLVRCDGGFWPCQTACSDGFTIAYEWGVPPPAGGVEMAGILACEFARASIPGCECRLPKRAQTIVQEGITTAVLLGDPLAMLDAGATGIPEVDMWVRTLNPGRLTRSAKMLTPVSVVEQTHHLR